MLERQKNLNSLRIVFSKSKNAVFLTHIDVFNVFEQAFIRADIKIKYTEKKNVFSQFMFRL